MNLHTPSVVAFEYYIVLFVVLPVREVTRVMVTCNTNSYVQITLYYIQLKYNLLQHPKQVS